MVAELVEPIPADSAENGTGKRRAGRPPTLNPDGTRKHPPKATGKPRPVKRSAPKTPGKPRKSLAPEIAALLTMLDSVILLSPIGTRPMEASPMLPFETPAATKVGDELDAAEIKLLAAALDRQCQRSPRFRKYVEKVLGAGSGGMLFGTIGMIAARRAARHGMLPAIIDPTIGILMESGDMSALAAMMGTPAPNTEPDPVTAETEPDRSVDYETVE
jgi:hypothetical protein